MRIRDCSCQWQDEAPDLLCGPRYTRRFNLPRLGIPCQACCGYKLRAYHGYGPCAADCECTMYCPIKNAQKQLHLIVKAKSASLNSLCGQQASSCLHSITAHVPLVVQSTFQTGFPFSSATELPLMNVEFPSLIKGSSQHQPLCESECVFPLPFHDVQSRQLTVNW